MREVKSVAATRRLLECAENIGRPPDYILSQDLLAGVLILCLYRGLKAERAQLFILTKPEDIQRVDKESSCLTFYRTFAVEEVDRYGSE